MGSLRRRWNDLDKTKTKNVKITKNGIPPCLFFWFCYFFEDYLFEPVFANEKSLTHFIIKWHTILTFLQTFLKNAKNEQITQKIKYTKSMSEQSLDHL
jgi:hypothetical protein